MLDRTSPLANVRRITRPVLMAHGTLDVRVPFPEAEQMVAALRKQHTPVWYMVAKSEGHFFNNTETKDVAFFLQVLFIRTIVIGF